VVLRRKPQSTLCVSVRSWLHSGIHIWVPSFWTQRILGNQVLGPSGSSLKEQGSSNLVKNMEHKGPVLRPRCIRPGRAWTQIPFNSIQPTLLEEKNNLWDQYPVLHVVWHGIVVCVCVTFQLWNQMANIHNTAGYLNIILLWAFIQHKCIAIIPCQLLIGDKSIAITVTGTYSVSARIAISCLLKPQRGASRGPFMNTIHVLWFIKDFNLKYERKVLKCHDNLYIHMPMYIIWLTLFPKVPFLEAVAVVHRFHSFPSQCPDPQWVHHWCRAKENTSSHIAVGRVVRFKPWLFYPHGNSPLQTG